MDLHISLSDRRNVVAHLYSQIREAILDGRLRAREALPSSRDLGRQLHVSRNSVLQAYERLCAEGFLFSRKGAGTFVSDGIETRSTGTAPIVSPLKPRSIWNEIPEGLDMAATTADIELRPGIPDAKLFPWAAWRARVSQQCRQPSGVGAPIAPAGHNGLRAALARHIAISRAVRTTAEDVFITSGSQQAIDLIAKVLLASGDTVAVEDPGYPLVRRAFHAYGARVVGVPVDEEGLVVDAIPVHARLVYVTPSHQYPLGMTLSLARRRALLAWAQQADATIVEDDYDSEYRYGGRPLDSLQSMDASGRVLYVGSLSKVMLPTLRLGFVVAPTPLQAALRKAKYLADWHTAVPMQGAAAQFIEDGLLAQHIHRMRRVYAERHQRILHILARDFAGRLTPLPSGGGIHLTALLPEGNGCSDVTITQRAHSAGVALLALSYHYVSARPRPGILLGYGAVKTERIEEGLRRLSDCLT